MAKFTVHDLDAFVAQTDAHGGPGAPDAIKYWEGFQYVPSTQVDQSIDPYSDEYMSHQLALYRELSGREPDATITELTPLDVERHVQTSNPYGVRDPSNFVLHYLRLGLAIRRAHLPAAPKVLDMGAGWGLSSEFFATLGCDVTAVDVNPDFVDLIRRRQSIHGNDIKAIVATFDDFEPSEAYDAVVFYECLHHATQPWKLLERVASWLAPHGKIVFAGEPVNDYWWKNWGMRLDAQSVYCIRKFGWFESGWSRAFIVECLQRAGLSVDYHDSDEPEVGSICVATRILANEAIPAAQLGLAMDLHGWTLDGEYLTASAKTSVKVPRRRDVESVHFDIWNFRPKQLHLTIRDDDGAIYSDMLAPGKSIIRCPLRRPATTLRFTAETWTPHAETGNGDMRELSFHISGATFV